MKFPFSIALFGALLALHVHAQQTPSPPSAAYATTYELHDTPSRRQQPKHHTALLSAGVLTFVSSYLTSLAVWQYGQIDLAHGCCTCRSDKVSGYPVVGPWMAITSEVCRSGGRQRLGSW